MDKSTTMVNVLVSHLGSTGGGPKFTYHLMHSLMGRTNISVHYLVSDRVDNHADFKRSNRPCIRIPTYSSKLELVFGLPRLLLSALRVRSYIKRNSISVVINAMESIYQGLMAPLAIPRGVRYVSSVHDAQSHPGDAHLIKILSRFGEWQRADCFAVFSEAVEEALATQPRVKGRPVLSTVHGVYASDVPIPARSQKAEGIPRNRPVVIGFLGRLSEYKGIPVLLEAVQLLRDRGHNVVAEIHGAGPEGRLADTPLGQKCQWNISWIDDAEIPGILDGFDILALPYTEASQSGVVAYALARGLPSVVTPVGGLGEQIAKSGSGVISRSTSAEDFADSLETLVKDDPLRIKLGQNALEASRSTYSWERVGDDFSAWLNMCS